VPWKPLAPRRDRRRSDWATPAGITTPVERTQLTRVTVVIPVLDQAAELDTQLGAVTAQQVRLPVEIVVADNGSKDGTAAVIARWERVDARVRGLDASAQPGPAAARNVGVAAAAGDALAFCDADDVVAPGWLDACVEALAGADVVAGAFDFGALNGDQAAVPMEYYASHFDFLPAGLGANLAVRTAAFREVGGFDQTLRAGEDIDLCWRLQLRGHRFESAPRAVVAKRERSEARTRRLQLVSYGRHDAVLYRRFRGDGMRRNDWLTLKTYAWLLVNAPLTVVGRSRRRTWSRAFFLRLGRLRGSLEHRVFYP